MAGMYLLEQDLFCDPKLYRSIINSIDVSMSSAVPASTRHNAFYTSTDFNTCMIAAAVCSGQVSGCTTSVRSILPFIAKGKRYPTDEWVQIIAAKMDPDRMLECFREMVMFNLKLLVRLGSIDESQALDLAIDMHLIPRYDKKYGSELVRSKFKDGTCVFERYISVQCIVAGCRLVLGVPAHARAGRCGRLRA